MIRDDLCMDVRLLRRDQYQRKDILVSAPCVFLLHFLCQGACVLEVFALSLQDDVVCIKFVYPSNKNSNNLSAMRSSRMFLQHPTQDQDPNTITRIMI
jgi:hypothetical protein